MSEMTIIDIGRKTLMMILILSGPMLALSLVVGLAVSIFQAATQITEMTLTFIPKLVAMGFALLITLPWMLQLYKGFFLELLEQIPVLIR
ncbi:MAG TPA: flagellar biosynthesis protein FliQ [Fibrobacteria bacterium]|nr:flagellar biosynthesis protein FliQ [Fibrobacteria bacterium]